MMSSHHLLIPILAACFGLGGAGCDRPESGLVPADTVAQAAGPGGDRSGPADPEGATIDLGYTLGDPAAPIHVVEFSDFGCPYCARFARTTLPELREEYIETGVVHWRFVPVVFGFAGGEAMGLAAVCAAELGEAGAFWRAHDLLYTRQVALREEGARPRLLDWLSEQGIGREALDQCMDRPDTRERLVEYTRASQQWLVRGTPTFVVNGVPMSGALPTDFFRMVFATVLDPSGL